MATALRILLLVVYLALGCNAALAAEAAPSMAYHVLPAAELPDAGAGALNYNLPWDRWTRWQAMRPYAVLTGPGRAHVDVGEGGWGQTNLSDLRVAIKAPRGHAVRGRLYVPTAEADGMRPIAFEIAADALTAEPSDAYHETVEAHYQQLWEADFLGGAWFRHQVREARAARGVLPAEPERGRGPAVWGVDPLTETYELYTGARAASENLELHAFLEVAEGSDETAATVAVDEITGITVEPVDWAALLADLEPVDDPLALRIPADQYAIFLPSLAAGDRLLSEWQRHLSPLLGAADPHAGGADIVQRYLNQLALPWDELADAAEAAGLRAIAITGSDPYWPSGTDVAVLFEVDDPAPLHGLLHVAQLRTAERMGLAVETRPTSADGAEHTIVATADGAVRSHLLQLDEHTVVLANSPVQVERLQAVAANERPAMGELDEFTFMANRHRYRDGASTAVLLITDEAIRKWGSARWRIAASRRIRMLAAMQEQQAVHLDALLAGTVEPAPLDAQPAVPDAGEMRLTEQSIVSTVYGSPRFLTPIAHLDIDSATEAEANAYRTWRSRYEGQWQAFDPIGLSLTLDDDRVELDLTVLPLTRSSEYRQMVELAGESEIGPDAGDPHAEAIAQFVMAVDVTGQQMRQAVGMAQMMGLGENPFGWLGETVSVYLDDDPLWDELLKSEDADAAYEQVMTRLSDVPLGLDIAVRDRMRLTAFLVGVRGLIQQTAPEVTTWENFEHAGVPYVRVTVSDELAAEEQDDAVVHYAVRDTLTLTLSEALMHRALERHVEQQQPAAAADGPAPAADADADAEASRWLGRHMAVHLRGRAFELLARMQGDDQLAWAQHAAWRALPILNEWRQRYPDRDPLDVHETFTGQRLTDPAGGNYVWDETAHTMASSVYGHPGAPRRGPALVEQLQNMQDARFGVSFEHDGLRGRAILRRTSAPPEED